MYAIIKYKDAENIERQSSIRVSNETEDQAVEKFIRIHNSNADHKITKNDIISVKFQKSAISFDLLKELKEQLFDASPEVKTAFNNVVQYFSGKSNSKQWYVAAEIFTGNGQETDWRDTFINRDTKEEAEKDRKASLEANGLKVKRIKAFPCTIVTSRGGKSYPDYDIEAVKKWESKVNETKRKYTKEDFGKWKGPLMNYKNISQIKRELSQLYKIESPTKEQKEKKIWLQGVVDNYSE